MGIPLVVLVLVLASYAMAQSPAVEPYVPLTAKGRLDWVIGRSVGPKNLAAGLVGAGIQTWRNRPEEWGGTWEGFGKRYGTRQANLLISNSIEASVGSLWGEDPRYFPSRKSGWWARTSYAVGSAFMSYRRDGTRAPAYARFIGMMGGRAISSTWRPPSDRDWHRTTLQPFGTGIGFRMSSNVFREFWPDLRRKFKR